MEAASSPALKSTGRPAFDTPNILWFFGAFTVFAASVSVIGEVSHSARGLWILLVSLGFMFVYAAASHWLHKQGSEIPSGVLLAMAVLFVPIGGSAFERLIGVWSDTSQIEPAQSFHGAQFALALATIVAGLVAYRLAHFPFIFAIVVGASFAATQLIFPAFDSHASASAHATWLIVVGTAFLGYGVMADQRNARQVAFWWHIVGLLALTTGLAYHEFKHSSWGWELMLVVGLTLLVLAAPLRRATWGLFGVAGTYAPIAHYADSWFGTIATGFTLTAVGFGLVALGIAFRASGDSWAGLMRRKPTASA